MTPSSQQQTVAGCTKLRESCPSVTWIKLAVPFAGLIVVAVAGCWGVSLWAFGMASEVDSAFGAHEAGQEKSDRYVVESMEEIKADLKFLRSQKGE